MAKIVNMQEAAWQQEYEEFTRLLNSSILCVKRCSPEIFPYTKAVLEIVKTDEKLQQGLLVLMRNFQMAVQEDMKVKLQLKK